jgi:hypothetical protein
MTARRACPPAPGPLEDYAAQFDPLFRSVAQRRSFREYLQGLLLPRERRKTLTGLVGAEPIVQAQAPPVQRLQFFLAEAPWDVEALNARRLEVVLGEAATMPHDRGVLVIDDTGDRKKGTHTAHVGRQYLGSVGKIDGGIVAVSSLWADEQVYYPLHVRPYTPDKRLPLGKHDSGFRTKPQLAVELVDAALEAGVPFRAVVADCAYGDNLAFEESLQAAGLPFVLGLKPAKGVWVPLQVTQTPDEVARHLRWRGPKRRGAWRPITRHFRDGHAETWWAAELVFAYYGPERLWRAIVATTDPATLPPETTWYLTTNLPQPSSARANEMGGQTADLAELVRLYALRTWVEQGYRQMKQELGWADFMVRSDRAIRRHWALVCCAFSFCWRSWFAPPAVPDEPPTSSPDAAREPATPAGRGKNAPGSSTYVPNRATSLLAGRPPASARLAGSLDLPRALLASVVHSAPASGTAGAPRMARRRPSALPLPPALTK